MACLHASDGCRGRLPYTEERLMHPACVAPKSRPCAGALAGLFPGVCVAQDLGRLDGAGGAGLGNSPTTVLEELARIHSTDVVAPTTDGRSIRLRCVVHPDKAQSILLSHLGLKLPQRLRLPSGLGQI